MPRQYEETHPWITFSADLGKLGVDDWLLLGEIRSKLAHLGRALLKPSVAQEMHQVFLTKGALGTTAIEGNTLTEDEARRVIEHTLTLPPSREYQAREIENIVYAFNVIKEHLLSGADDRLSVDRLEGFNAMVLDGLDVDEGVVPGKIRDHSVLVGGAYRGAPSADCRYLVERLCDWLNGPDFHAPRAGWSAPMAVVKAVIAHLYIAWVHPFGDGNGRTARLAEMQILMAQGFPTPACHLLSNHYNETRSEYGRQLARASMALDAIGFLRYALRGMVDGLQQQLDRIWMQQFNDRWEQFIYEAFGGTNSRSQIRQRELALEVSKHDVGVPVRDLRRLTPELVEAYVGKTAKTVTRDVNALIAKGVVVRERGFVRPAREQLLGFMPVRRQPEFEISLDPSVLEGLS